MFRDLKEYQEIAKIYADKVSKPEDLDERVRGGGVPSGGPEKKFTPTPQKGMGGGTGNPTNRRGSGARNNRPKPEIKKPEIKKFPTTAEIRAGSDRVGGGNAGASTDSGGTQGQGGAPEIKKPQSKFMKRERGKVGFVKRGTPGAQRAENQEKAKLRAQAMAKARIEAKKKAEMSESVDLTPYDIVLEYLLSTEQAATIEEANYIMTEMDAETIQSIVAE